MTEIGRRRALVALLGTLGVAALLASVPALVASHAAVLVLTLPVAALLLYGAWIVLHEDHA